MRSKGGSAPSTRPAQATKATAVTKMGATNSKSATAMKKAVTVKKTDMQAMKKVGAAKMKAKLAPRGDVEMTDGRVGLLMWQMQKPT
jgi:hypothetical protein